jgi:O-antigen/teichoic acid export membrane protein
MTPMPSTAGPSDGPAVHRSPAPDWPLPQARSPIGRLRSSIRTVVRGDSGVTATLQTLLARGAVLGVNLATGVITAQALGATGRGQLAALGVGTIFFAGVLTLGLPSSVIFNFRKYPAARPGLLGAAILMSLALGLLATALGVVLLPRWLAGFDPQIVLAAQLLMLNAPVVLLVPVLNAALEASGEFHRSNIVRLAIPSLALAGLLVMAGLGVLTPIRAALCYVFNGLPVLWMLYRLWRLYRPTLAGLGQSLRRLTSFGVRSYGIDLLNTLALQIDQVLVVGFLAAAQVGAYVVALSAARLLNVVQLSVVTVLFPKVASKDPAQVVEAVGRAARWTAAATAGLGAVLYLLGPVLLGVLYGREFVHATPLLRLLIFEVVLAGLVAVLAQAFMALGRPGWVAVSQAAGLLLVVPLMAVLVPRYGLMGAGWAMLASSLVRFVFILASYPLVLNLRPPCLILRVSDVRGLLARRARPPQPAGAPPEGEDS